MKNLVLTIAIALLSANSFAQSTDGKDEFNEALFATSQKKTAKAEKYFEKSYKKGFIPTHTELLHNQWSWMLSPYRRLEGLKKCAENGDPECMFVYGVENIDKLDDIENSSILKPLATTSIQEAYDYMVKAAKAGYEPAYLYLGDKATKAGDTINAIKIYQLLADKGNQKAQYKVAILKKDAKTAFEVIKDIKEDPFLYDPLASGEEIFKSAEQGNDSKFAIEAARIFSAKAAKYTGIKGSHDLYANRASDLYKRACELGNGEGCYQYGLLYLNDYRDHENGEKWFVKAIALGYKIPEEELQKMKNPPSTEEVKKLEAKLQYEAEQSAKWAKSHPNEDEIEYKENAANNKTKRYLTQSDMDKIIKANFPASSSEDDRHRKEMEKQAKDAEKIKNGTWNGH